jgi:hypothetical protein
MNYPRQPYVQRPGRHRSHPWDAILPLPVAEVVMARRRAGVVGLTLRPDLVVASAPDAAASSCAAPDVVQDVLQHQAGPHQAHTVAVHQLQEILPGLIDEGDRRQVNRERPVRMARLGGVPAVF